MLIWKKKSFFLYCDTETLTLTTKFNNKISLLAREAWLCRSLSAFNNHGFVRNINWLFVIEGCTCSKNFVWISWFFTTKKKKNNGCWISKKLRKSSILRLILNAKFSTKPWLSQAGTHTQTILAYMWADVTIWYLIKVYQHNMMILSTLSHRFARKTKMKLNESDKIFTGQLLLFTLVKEIQCKTVVK